MNDGNYCHCHWQYSLSFQVRFPQLIEGVIRGPSSQVLNVHKVVVRYKLQTFVQVTDEGVIEKLVRVPDVGSDGVGLFTSLLSRRVVHPVHFLQDLKELTMDVVDHFEGRLLAATLEVVPNVHGTKSNTQGSFTLPPLIFNPFAMYQCINTHPWAKPCTVPSVVLPCPDPWSLYCTPGPDPSTFDPKTAKLCSVTLHIM